MTKINNKEVIHRIADKSRRAAKTRNLVVILAIALTTLLFTSIFTVGGSIFAKIQESTMRQVGGSAHAGYKYLTQAEYDIVKGDKWLKDISYRITVGNAVNDALNKLYTEVGFYEEDNAKGSFCYPTEGKMPEAGNEIVTSDLVLEALGIPCELGITVPLVLDIGGKRIEEDFVLSGYYEGDVISMAQIVMVSKAYQESNAPVNEIPFGEAAGMTPDQYVGRIMADVNFYIGFAIETQMLLLSERCGFENVETGINWAYVGSDVDFGAVVVIGALLALIIFAGYLIIYNIFYINVYAEIRHYGLLKTIGTTGKQLKKIVKRQAYALSAVGIPIGVVLGVLVGGVLLPKVMGQLNLHNTAGEEVELNIWIFVFSALFAFFTVYISCIKPCRAAAKVTPIEALRTTEVSGSEKLQIKEKKSKRVTPRQMALQNLKRSKKKLVVVVASLSLALVLLNSVFGIMGGFDMDKYVEQMIISDFSIADATLDNVGVKLESRDIAGVTEDFLAELKEQKGIEELANIYISGILGNQKFSEKDWELVKERILKNPVILKKEFVGINIEELTKEQAEEYSNMLIEVFSKERALTGDVYGIDEMLMGLLENVEGELDWEKFKTGDYIITGRYGLDGEKINYFYPGERITVYNAKGETREYEVMAVAELPYPCRYQAFTNFDCNYILPSEEFLDFIEEKQPMRTLVNMEEGYEEALEKWCADYCENVNPNMDYNSKAKLEAEFATMEQTLSLVGGLLVFILAIIGILNFINTMVTSVLSRRQELAMLEAVGMSGTQQKQMLIWEGLSYAFSALVIAILLAVLLNITVVRSFCNSLYFATWRFTLLPIILCIPLILTVVVLVPLLCYKNLKKESVVERIRSYE